MTVQLYSLLATVVNVEVRLVPTALHALIAATAISAAIRPYSTAVAACSFFRSLVNVWSTASSSRYGFTGRPGRNRRVLWFGLVIPGVSGCAWSTRHPRRA